MSLPSSPTTPTETTDGEEARFTVILNFMIPVFLPCAKNDLDLARQAALQALDACEAATMPELEAAARAICLDHSAMESLGESMRAELTDAQRLRYRTQAVALTRAAELSRRTLSSLRARRLTQQKAAQPQAPARPAPPPPAGPPQPTRPTPPSANPPVEHKANPLLPDADPDLFPQDLPAMMRASSALLADLQSRLADPGPPPEVPPNAFLFGQNGFQPGRPAP